MISFALQSAQRPLQKYIVWARVTDINAGNLMYFPAQNLFLKEAVLESIWQNTSSNQYDKAHPRINMTEHFCKTVVCENKK